jgi:hypothetical protein
MPEDEVPVYISRKLYEEVERKVDESEGEFKSVEEFVEYVLKELLKEEEETPYTSEDEEEIKKRLKALGYI